MLVNVKIRFSVNIHAFNNILTEVFKKLKAVLHDNES